MVDMPETRALLGVDVIGSAGNPGYHLERIWGALTTMLGDAFDASGITPDDVVREEPTGDGALYTVRAACLGSMIDLSDRMDGLARRHNRWQRPDLRLRIAIHIGAVGDGPGYFAPKIHLNRMLDARAFKLLVNRCVDTNRDAKGNSPVNSGLILSDAARREVFGGDYTTAVQETDFAELEVVNKEFMERTWVRVPGVDARTLADFAKEAVQAPEQVEREGRAGGVNVSNHISGRVGQAIQAGVIRGGVHLGKEPR